MTVGPAISFINGMHYDGYDDYEDYGDYDYEAVEGQPAAGRVSLSMSPRFGFNYRLVNKLSLVGMFGLQVRGGEGATGFKDLSCWSIGPTIQIGISF